MVVQVSPESDLDNNASKKRMKEEEKKNEENISLNDLASYFIMVIMVAINSLKLCFNIRAARS